MKKVELSLAVGIYDRTFPIFDGHVEIEGCNVNAVPLLPDECLHRAFKFAEFDVTEMSLSSDTVWIGSSSSRRRRSTFRK